MSSLRSAAKMADLIYDVGMHKGEDTDYYLKKGFRVVAFEANPELVALGRQRFESAIRAGLLVIVSGAIAPATGGSEVTFYRNRDQTVWGTISEEFAVRNQGFGAPSDTVKVPRVEFSDCLQEFGMPYYLKVDIEGADRCCLEALKNFSVVPNYLSIEVDKTSPQLAASEFDAIEGLGYDEFCLVQQVGMERVREPSPVREGLATGHAFAAGSSGLFGLDLSGPWRRRRELAIEYVHIHREYRWFGDNTWFRTARPGRKLRNLLGRVLGRPLAGWYDLHARRSADAKAAAR